MAPPSSNALNYVSIPHLGEPFSDENDFSTYVDIELVNLPLGSAHYSYHASIAIQYWNTASS
jgi:hypothetical protein